MVAAVNARNSGAKTPGQAQVERMWILNMKRLACPVLQTVVTRPTSAVKPTNVPSKVDSGLVRAGPGRTPVMRQQRSHSPARGQQRSHSPGPAASAASARKRKRSTLSLFLGCGRRWLDSLEGEKDVFLPGRKFAHLDICWLGWENVSLIDEKC